jgi:predicted transcriptional regulator
MRHRNAHQVDERDEMTVARDRYFANMADKAEGNYHDVNTAYSGRVVQSEGAFGRAWLRFNPGVQLIYVDDAEGKPHGLTPKQYAVLTIVMDTIAAGTHPTMTKLARSLGYSVSTVSRALVKLAAWGLIGYVCSKGRYAAMIMFRRADGDGLDRLRRVAKAKIRKWYQASQDRISRLRFNVATGNPTTTYGVYAPVSRTTSTDTVMVATLKPEWTVEDLRDAGII